LAGIFYIKSICQLFFVIIPIDYYSYIIFFDFIAITFSGKGMIKTIIKTVALIKNKKTASPIKNKKTASLILKKA
jgi:hypothetical protein